MASRKRNSVIEEFIDIYKFEYCLWRVQSKEYHDKNKRATAYEKLLVKLKELEPNATKDDVIKKINSLRSNVRKEKKKYNASIKSGASADEVYKPTLWYYDLFDFLGDQDTPRESRSNIENDKDDSPINFADISTENNDAVNAGTEKDFNSTNQDPTNQEQQLPTNSRSSFRPTKKTSEDKLTNEVLVSVKEHFKRPAPQEDRYDLLGKTIAIKLRMLEKRQRLIAEKIINDTLFEAEMGNLNYDSYQGRNMPQYHTAPYISTPSPTYISSPIPSPNSNSGLESPSPSMFEQSQTTHSQSYNQIHSGSSQNYVIQYPQTPPIQLSVPDNTLSASSYFSSVNLENI